MDLFEKWLLSRIDHVEKKLKKKPRSLLNLTIYTSVHEFATGTLAAYRKIKNKRNGSGL